MPTLAEYNPHLGYKDEVVRTYLRLVYKVANQFRWAVSGSVGFEDLISEGTIGLIKAFDRFDPNKFEGRVTKFSTYAVPMIEGEIRRFIRDKRRLIKTSRPLYVISLDQTIRSPKGKDNTRSIQETIPITADFSGIYVSEFIDSLDIQEKSIVQMRIACKKLSEIARSLRLTEEHTKMKLLEIGNKLQEYLGLESGVYELAELTKERYLELKSQGLSDGKICEVVQVGLSSLYRRKKKWGLSSSNPPTSKKEVLNKESTVQPAPSTTELGGEVLKLKKELEQRSRELAAIQEKLNHFEQENQMLKALLKIYL